MKHRKHVFFIIVMIVFNLNHFVYYLN